MLTTPGAFHCPQTSIATSRMCSLIFTPGKAGVASLSLVQPRGFTPAVPSDCSCPPHPHACPCHCLAESCSSFRYLQGKFPWPPRTG